MAKEINLEDSNEKFASKHSNIVYRDQMEYVGSKLFWSAALVLGAATIYASLAYLIVQQLRK